MPLRPEAAELLAQPYVVPLRRRWPGMGAWIAYDPLLEPSGWAVGIMLDGRHGAHRHTLGRGGSPEAAIRAADRREEREAEPAKPRKKKRPEGEPYPIAGDLFDESIG